jgi:hypothetical protein
VSTGRTFPTSVAAPVLLESLKITGRVRPLQVIHRFQALLATIARRTYADVEHELDASRNNAPGKD